MIKTQKKLLQLSIAFIFAANIYMPVFADANQGIGIAQEQNTQMASSKAENSTNTDGTSTNTTETPTTKSETPTSTMEATDRIEDINKPDDQTDPNNKETLSGDKGTESNGEQIHDDKIDNTTPKPTDGKSKVVLPADKPVEVTSLVKRIEVEAVINANSTLYASYGSKKKVGSVLKNTKVIYIRDKREVWAHVRLSDGNMGWMTYKNLNVSNKEYKILEDLNEKQKNEYVNKMKYTSKTKYLVWVNLERQKTNIFTGGAGTWKLVKSFDCSTGKNATPTVNGEFNYIKKLTKWSFFDYFVKKVMIFYDTFAFHSIPYKYSGSVLDGTLNKPSSHGCVRLAQKDIDWLYKMLPIGTKIVIK